MTTNSDLITTFYSAFQRKDHQAMAACYHPEISFSDPVFPDLHGQEVAAMWHMLCERGTDLDVAFSKVNADGTSGSAHWEATYTFGPSKRTIHNIIDAAFVFQDGLIIEHRDDFDLWRWIRMATGAAGIAIGWTPAAKGKVRSTAARGLSRFLEDHPEYSSEA